MWRNIGVLVEPSSGRVKVRCAKRMTVNGLSGAFEDRCGFGSIWRGYIWEGIIVGAENSGQCGDLGSRFGHGMT